MILPCSPKNQILGTQLNAGELLAEAMVSFLAKCGIDQRHISHRLTSLGILYLDQGQYSQAEPLIRRAMEICERTLGSWHPDTAVGLSNLATLYLFQGKFSDALSCQRRSLEILEKSSGLNHPHIVTCLRNLARIHAEQGEQVLAASVLRKALAVQQHSLDRDIVDIAITILALHRVEESTVETEPLICQALEILERPGAPRHPMIADLLEDLAVHHQYHGRYVQSREALVKALAIKSRTHGSNHPETASSMICLAIQYQIEAEYAEAEELLRKAHQAYMGALGRFHPHSIFSLWYLAGHYYSQLDYEKAAACIAEFQEAIFVFLARELPLGSSRTRQVQFRRFSPICCLSSRLATRYSPAIKNALWLRLNRHGLLHEIERRQNVLLRYAQCPAREQLDRLKDLVTALASRDLAPKDRTLLGEQKDELERMLYGEHPELEIRPCTIDEVAAALPEGCIFVEFEHLAVSNQYIAFVLSPEASVRLINFGPAAELESMIEAALFSSSSGLPEDADQWLQVSNQLMGPLLSELENSRHWCMSLDGALHRIPFNALPWPGEPARWLTDTVAITLLTSGRDLLDVGDPIKSEGTSVVVANPSFDHSIVASGIPDSEGGGRSRDMGSLEAWDLLPGTAEEGLRVAELLDASLLMESEATTINLQRAVHPRILHAATHGYFLPDQPDPDPEGSMRQIHDSFSPLASFRGEDPMLRSGLVLAGANNPEANPHDDGYLTALEATHLDLQGTELVTLSACDTGRGDIRTGEGVYGLQRALIVAGARSMLLSLWKVPDDATCAFMVRFYTLLKQGAGRYEALVGVQREFRNHSNPIWRDIYYWGAWQLIGDWRPIDGL